MSLNLTSKLQTNKLNIALIFELKLAKKFTTKAIMTKGDSYLVANQANRTYEIRVPNLVKHMEKEKPSIFGFENFKVE